MVEKLLANAGDRTGRFSPWSGRYPAGGLGNPLQYSRLRNPMDRGTCRTVVGRAGGRGLGSGSTVHRVTKSRTQMKQLSKHAHTYGIPSSRVKDPAVIKVLVCIFRPYLPTWLNIQQTLWGYSQSTAPFILPQQFPSQLFIQGWQTDLPTYQF